jgi:hypothetical protein
MRASFFEKIGEKSVSKLKKSIGKTEIRKSKRQNSNCKF